MLEKILEETERIINMHYEDDSVKAMILRNLRNVRKHMNEDTIIGISIDDERLWQILFDEACVEGEQAERIYAELRGISKGGWIPCEERMPEKSGHYLVQLSEKVACEDYSDMLVVLYEEEFRQFLSYDSYIIAWQPLPERYRPEKGEETC